jgi:hypothetical protein
MRVSEKRHGMVVLVYKGRLDCLMRLKAELPTVVIHTLRVDGA